MSIPRLRQYNGPAIMSYGFRPFFLFGALFSGLAILAWVLMLDGSIRFEPAVGALDWHIHEMIFGFLPAIVTGFLLTAVPNWTGRLPVQGKGLAVLTVTWIAGRIAMADPGWLGPLAAAVIDLAFLAAVMGVIANEIVAGRNWRNLKVLVPLTLLFAGNTVFHFEMHLDGTSDHARRMGMAAAILLIMIIGGRIIPSFTRNWLVRANPGRLPAPFGQLDKGALVLSAVALIAWIVLPAHPATGVAMIAAGLANLVRQMRWAGERTAGESLVLILHLAFLFVPLGFLLSGAGALMPDAVSPAAGMHAFGAGAAGAMVLAVMMRATLGHTGQALTMGRGSKIVFACLVASAAIRIAAALAPQGPGILMILAGLLWSAAFLGFGLVYGKALISPRR
ncbi:NnrS family protein [Zhengella sp. ZM62]|uniref:NnrS family protein n=1 Tax=Zhengella sedimenti TaxID=3390035 RepID=UPI003974B4E4